MSKCQPHLLSLYSNKTARLSQILFADNCKRVLLTLEMNFLSLDLCRDAHGNLVKFVLQGLDLLAYVLNRALSSLFCEVLSMLVDDKVDFLRFAVVLLPAHLDVSFVVTCERIFGRCLFINSFQLCAVLGNLQNKQTTFVSNLQKENIPGMTGFESLTVKRTSFSLTPVTV